MELNLRVNEFYFLEKNREAAKNIRVNKMIPMKSCVFENLISSAPLSGGAGISPLPASPTCMFPHWFAMRWSPILEEPAIWVVMSDCLQKVKDVGQLFWYG